MKHCFLVVWGLFGWVFVVVGFFVWFFLWVLLLLLFGLFVGFYGGVVLFYCFILFSSLYEQILFCGISSITSTCCLGPQLKKVSPMYIQFALTGHSICDRQDFEIQLFLHCLESSCFVLPSFAFCCCWFSMMRISVLPGLIPDVNAL